MSELVVAGLSHHTAPLSVRERYALAEADQKKLVADLQANGLREVAVLSTCNRVEIYAASDEPESALGQLVAALVERGGAAPDDVIYRRVGKRTVRHAFRVASSLDSMVVGEPQILGQLKDAHSLAASVGAIGGVLGRCFDRAFAVAKRVRTETGIAEGTVSVSSIAAQLAKKIFGELTGRQVLLLGAGEMGEAAAKALASSGARLVVINRSPEKAERVAQECGGQHRGYEQMAAALVEADVVITSTSSDRYVLTRDLMKNVVRGRRQRPLFLIDIAVPRDVDPRVGDLGNVFLYDVDDLQQIANENIARRKSEALHGEDIVRAEVREFEAWRATLSLTPTIVALRERFARVIDQELARTSSKAGFSEDQLRALDKMKASMINKLLHAPMTELRRGAHEAEAAALIEVTRRLFQIEDGENLTESDERSLTNAKRKLT